MRAREEGRLIEGRNLLKFLEMANTSTVLMVPRHFYRTCATFLEELNQILPCKPHLQPLSIFLLKRDIIDEQIG